MRFILFTPDRQFEPVECDSVRLNIADSTDGSFSGSYGIRKGHAKAVFSLKEGKITVNLKGQEVFSAECKSGFASVQNDEVRVTVDNVKEN